MMKVMRDDYHLRFLRMDLSDVLSSHQSIVPKKDLSYLKMRLISVEEDSIQDKQVMSFDDLQE